MVSSSASRSPTACAASRACSLQDRRGLLGGRWRSIASHRRAPGVGNAEADLPRGVHVDLEVAVTHHLDVHQQPARLDDHGAHTLGTSKGVRPSRRPRSRHRSGVPPGPRRARARPSRSRRPAPRRPAARRRPDRPSSLTSPSQPRAHHAAIRSKGFSTSSSRASASSHPGVSASRTNGRPDTPPRAAAGERMGEGTRLFTVCLPRGRADCARRPGVNREYRDGQSRSLVVTQGARAESC